ncbi:hypothetical protein WCX49_11715 [Sulfurimonas sp. HSL-1656]|uniref:hypothetical protein n=1 Tax=Thiomicrolovo subterrani TaxID=3131934 RepID=UPI0031F88A3D
MWPTLKAIFTGGVVNSIEKIALEAIDTDKEKAEAKSLFAKVLDPNGKMRRDLSRFASKMYGFYLISTTMLIVMVAFKIGDAEGAKVAATMMTDLFTPITASWATIVSASFSVNLTNSVKGV